MSAESGFRLRQWLSTPIPELQARLDAIPTCSMQHTRCSVLGPPRSGKTSLLLHYCYTLAASGRDVVLLCQRPKLELAPPLLPWGVQNSDPAFQRISIKYINTIQDLKRYGACLHLLPQPPAAVVIDDLSDILAASKLPDRRARDAEATKALAFLVDAAEAVGRALGQEVQLLLSDASSEDGQRSYLLQRWFPVSLQLTAHAPGGYTLQLVPNPGMHLQPQLTQVKVYYSLTRSYVNVETVIA